MVGLIQPRVWEDGETTHKHSPAQGVLTTSAPSFTPGYHRQPQKHVGHGVGLRDVEGSSLTLHS